jgi:hypothetical protein
MVHPASYLAVIPVQRVQRTLRMRPCGSEIAKRMETVDMTATNKRVYKTSRPVIGVPVGKLTIRHVEIQGITDFEPQPLPQQRVLPRIEETRYTKVHIGIRCLIQVAADSQHRLVWIREPSQTCIPSAIACIHADYPLLTAPFCPDRNLRLAPPLTPHLERQQRPDWRAKCAIPAVESVNDLRHEFGIHDAGVPDAPLSQQVPNQGPQVRLEPTF